ncbi:MAG: dephospho-CoA kinase [Clostridiales bacterium]|nr:dephospho-CoA kinase [Clostridiales bacterium]
MKIIGLTGGISSGKSTVSRMLMELGVTVIDADVVYKSLALKGNPVWKAVHEAFGNEFFLSDGEINWKKLGEHVFSDNMAREKLNQVTHPLVKDEMVRILRKLEEEQNPPLVVLDVPLLFESEWEQWIDEVWLVTIPEQMQLERLMLRDRLSYNQALSRIRSQMSLEMKKGLSDIVIDNSGSIQQTRLQVQELLKDLLPSEDLE